MKFHHLALLTSLGAAAAGCSEGTPGGPGVAPTTSTPTQTTAPQREREPMERETVTASKPVLGEADDTFTIDVPVLATRLVQGETKKVAIGLNRGRNFDQDVTLELSNLPQGVTVEPAQPMIKHGEEEATISVHAAEDAALGDFTIDITGRPSDGANAMNQWNLTVSRAE